MTSELKQKLSQICQNNGINDNEYPKYGGSPTKYDRFPYAPYIPKDWNKILVLAESQQLRGLNDGNEWYRQSLLAMEDEELIFRLGNKRITGKQADEQIGITPWDEGYMKLAMLSCFPEFTIDQFGVSNAVPWHLDKDNKTQASLLKRKSIALWKEILPELKPRIIICTGEIAASIIFDTCFCSDKRCLQLNIRSASQLGRVAYLFNENDLLSRYREVESAYSRIKKIVEIDEKDKRYFVFYAAHAVSKIKPALNKQTEQL